MTGNFATRKFGSCGLFSSESLQLSDIRFLRKLYRSTSTRQTSILSLGKDSSSSHCKVAYRPGPWAVILSFCRLEIIQKIGHEEQRSIVVAKRFRARAGDTFCQAPLWVVILVFSPFKKKKKMKRIAKSVHAFSLVYPKKARVSWSKRRVQ